MGSRIGIEPDIDEVEPCPCQGAPGPFSPTLYLKYYLEVDTNTIKYAGVQKGRAVGNQPAPIHDPQLLGPLFIGMAICENDNMPTINS